jgi:hypothetical protein
MDSSSDEYEYEDYDHHLGKCKKFINNASAVKAKVERQHKKNVIQCSPLKETQKPHMKKKPLVKEDSLVVKEQKAYTEANTEPTQQKDVIIDDWEDLL